MLTLVTPPYQLTINQSENCYELMKKCLPETRWGVWEFELSQTPCLVSADKSAFSFSTTWFQ